MIAALVAGLALTAPPPAQFAGRVDNPFLPFLPGTTWVYRGTEDGEPLRQVVTATRRTKLVAGVRCTVVRDDVWKNGKLAERTSDWYAQDRRGNVWYFGEATAEIGPNGKVTSTEGSWQAGVDGAQAGIVMPAHPRVGMSFRQELYKGHAEDHFAVLRVTKRELVAKEWTPLEPNVLEHKLYRRGTGLVREEVVKGGRARIVLVSMTR